MNVSIAQRQSFTASALFSRTSVLALAGAAIALTAATSAVKAADFPEIFTPSHAPSNGYQSHSAPLGGYVGLRGGFTMADDTDFRIHSATVNNHYDDWQLQGSVFAGTEAEFMPGLRGRLEAELGIVNFAIDSHTLNDDTHPLFGSAGDTSAITGLINAYVDADFGKFRPFVGFGGGLAQVSFEDHGSTHTGVIMNDDDSSFVWQISGGLAVDVTQHITLEGMVRYQSIMDVELKALDDTISQTDLATTSALAGIRYRF